MAYKHTTKPKYTQYKAPYVDLVVDHPMIIQYPQCMDLNKKYFEACEKSQEQNSEEDLALDYPIVFELSALYKNTVKVIINRIVKECHTQEIYYNCWFTYEAENLRDGEGEWNPYGDEEFADKLQHYLEKNGHPIEYQLTWTESGKQDYGFCNLIDGKW